MTTPTTKRNPWSWIPTLYFAEGLPYVAVMTIAVIMYKRLGLSNTEIALYTSWLYLPWTIKPLWSPFVDLVKTKRAWIIAMQGFIAAGFAGIAFFIPTAHYVQLTLAFFWLLAFSSATHDIAADGFYMLGLNNKEQSFFVGIRNTYLLAGLFLALTIYHRLILPHPDSDIKRPGLTPGKLLGDFLLTFVTFFQKKNLGLMFFFLLTYRLGESQLAKIASPFLLDTTDKGGLGLSTATVGMIYGTIGVIALLLGGIISGFLVSRDGFKKWILPMALAINIPDLLYVWMAAATPDNPIFIAICVAIEQLGYGFGFTAYMLYLIYIAEGEHKTAHYAIGTGFMALGMMIPGMPAGWIQEHLGYTNFFIWVCICTLPGIVASLMIRNRLEDSFGKKQ